MKEKPLAEHAGHFEKWKNKKGAGILFPHLRLSATDLLFCCSYFVPLFLDCFSDLAD